MTQTNTARLLRLIEAGGAMGALVMQPARTRLREADARDGQGLPATAYAWTPDPADPLTWRWPLTNADGEYDKELIDQAVAALPTAGITDADRADVVTRLTQAWKAVHPNVDVPAELSSSSEASRLRRNGRPMAETDRRHVAALVRLGERLGFSGEGLRSFVEGRDGRLSATAGPPVAERPDPLRAPQLDAALFERMGLTESAAKIAARGRA